MKYTWKVEEIHLKSGGNTGTGFWVMVLGVDWSVSRGRRSFSCLQPESPSPQSPALCKIAQKQSDAEESGGKEGNQASEEESGDKVGDTKESYMLSWPIPDNLIVGALFGGGP